MYQPNINPSEQNINREPVISPNPSNLPNKSNSFPKILIVVLLLVIFLTAGIFLGKTYFSPETPITAIPTIAPIIPPADPTADWKTYADNKFPFLFKYPTDTKVELLDGFSEVNNILIEVSPNNKNQFLIQVQNNPAGGQYLIVVNSPNKREIATKQWVISNVPERTVDFGYPLQGNGPFLVYQFINQNVSYAIIFNGSATDSIQDQILSTFKFL